MHYMTYMIYIYMLNAIYYILQFYRDASKYVVDALSNYRHALRLIIKVVRVAYIS